MNASDLKQKVTLSSYIGNYVKLKQNGNEYIGLCPFHDDHDPSFHVVDDKGFYHCFACGAHGDVIDFAMEYEAINYTEAIDKISGEVRLMPNPERRATTKQDIYAGYEPLPLPDAPLKPHQAVKIVNPKRENKQSTFRPTLVHRYPTHYVLRIEFDDGKKITPSVYWCRRGNWQGWVLYPMPEQDRDHYGELKKAGHVIIVEGEKTADFVAAKLPWCSVLTWPGGTNSHGRVKWPDLKDRDVWLLCDADEGGITAMEQIKAKLSQSYVRLVVPYVTPKGWDVADNVEITPEKLICFMADNVAHLPTAEEKPQSPELPLEKLELVYHPEHIKWSSKDGERKFKFATGTAENLKRLLVRYGIRLRYNEIARAIEMDCHGDGQPVGDLAGSYLASIVEDVCRLNRYPYTTAQSHFPRLASENTYNPVADYVCSKPWDGQSRIQELFECMTLAHPEQASFSYLLFRKWLLGAVAIALDRTDKFEHVLVLVDTEGGIGKTRFFNRLCPKPLQADGVVLDVTRPDSVFDCISKWLIELGEIDGTFKKSHVEAIKAFLSRSHDEMRRPYQREPAKFKRRTAFFGSVNSVDFLTDDTTNRRYWPIEITAINYMHDIDMQQVWAEALLLVDQNESWHLNKAENAMIGRYNKQHKHVTDVEEKILTWYDKDSEDVRHGVTATQVLIEIGVYSPTVAQKRKAGKLLRKLYAHKNHSGVTVYAIPHPNQQEKINRPYVRKVVDND